MKKYYRRFIDPGNRYCRWIDPRVRTLPLADVLAYLRRRGWTELPPDRPGFLVFQVPASSSAEGGPFCQFVPDSEEGDDYPLRMFELLTGLAEFENRQASEVIDDVVRREGDGRPYGAAQGQPRDPSPCPPAAP
jgi:hypothetical protein